MNSCFEKVTAFITRPEGEGSRQLLLFRHPYAGIQIPAGSVEENEDITAAVRREAAEETGLSDLRILHSLGFRDLLLPEDQRIILHTTRVYARPDASSFDWAVFRRGITVQRLQETGDFVQVSYIEWDDDENPTFITYQITGWIPAAALCQSIRRHFFELSGDSVAASWELYTDKHTFHLFWASIDHLPPLIAPQNEWLSILLAVKQ